MIVRVTQLTRSVCCCGGSVNEREAEFNAIIPNFLRITNVQLIKDLFSEFGGIRTRADVKDELDETMFLPQPVVEFRSFNFLAEDLSFEIPDFVEAGEIIDQNQVVIPGFVESGNKTTADESGGTGDDDHRSDVEVKVQELSVNDGCSSEMNN